MKESSRQIPVVYYHSIGPRDPEWNRRFLTLEVSYFEDQLKYFSRHFNIIDLRTYYDIRTGRKNPVENPLVITIDDGYLDNWIWAYPLLKKYEARATIFVSPEFVEPEPVVRPNLEDWWNGRVDMDDLHQNGYLSWEEMRLMEASGIIDIQSHTMTHTKYFVSDRLVDFHHPGGDALYPISNRFPDEKPFCIANKAFEQLIPYGTPLFEEQSSVIARRVTINPAFTEEVVNVLKNYDFSQYQFDDAFSRVQPVYDAFRKAGNIILETEPESGYLERLEYEIVSSKAIIEQQLQKTVEFLCWPHGDNTEQAHEMALEAGYLLTTAGKLTLTADRPDRIPDRLAVIPFLKNSKLGILKAKTKIDLLRGKGYARWLKNVYHLIKRNERTV